MLNSLSSSVDKLQSISSSISATLQEVSVDKQAPEEENCASGDSVCIYLYIYVYNNNILYIIIYTEYGFM